jgi:FlaA1/EpsC-like NDP-sugar epimerase
VENGLGDHREHACDPPAGQRRLDDATLRQLRDLTRLLGAARAGTAEEHARFLAIAERRLCLPETELADRLSGATVLVTGGTGCIGSALTEQLAHDILTAL